MFDPRDDARGRGQDGRERAYEGRDHTGDPRDVFLHDVDLPLDREREYVGVDKDGRDFLYLATSSTAWTRRSSSSARSTSTRTTATPRKCARN